MIWLTLFGGLALTIGGGASIGAALGLVGLIVLHFHADGATDLAILATFNVLNNFTLSALPIFVVMGEILVAGGLSARIYNALAPLSARMPGKLLHTNIAMCALFGAVSGSSTATAAAVASVSYPELARRGYDRGAILGSLAGGGTLGLLIPPSLSLLLYGAWQEVSIGQLFIAGIVPGLMMAGLFMVFIAGNNLLRRDLVPAAGERPSLADIVRDLLQIWPVVILIAAVLGTIYMGFATPTESAGLGVLFAIILGFAVGRLTVRTLLEAFLKATRSIGALMFVLIGAVILGQSVSILGLPREVVLFANSLGLGKYEVIVFVVLFYLVLGCFFDGITLMLLSLPFMYPVVIALGFDPVWFGVFVTIMIEIGLITPPVGMNLYVLASITGQEVPIGRIAAAAVPYWVLLLIGTALLTAFPGIVLFLPRLMYGS